MPDNPDTLPADFFSKQGNPDTLPADFFSKSAAPALTYGPTKEQLAPRGNPAVNALAQWLRGGRPLKAARALPDSSLGNFLSTAANDIKAVPSGIYNTVAHPADTLRNLVKPQEDPDMSLSEMGGHVAALGVLGSAGRALQEAPTIGKAIKGGIVDTAKATMQKAPQAGVAALPTNILRRVGQAYLPQPDTFTVPDAPRVSFKAEPEQPVIQPPPVAYRAQPAAPAPVEPPSVSFRPQPTKPVIPPPPVRMPTSIADVEPKMRPKPAPPIGRMRAAPAPEATPAPEPNTVTAPETAAPTLVDRPGISQMLHHAAAQVGIDHEMLSAISRQRFGVQSMTQLTEKQMLQMYSNLLSGDVPAMGPPLNLKTTGQPSTISLEDQLHRSIDLSRKRFTSGAAPAETPSDDITKYAKGGVIRKPHFLVDAKTGKTDGLMAEAGPERIVPLAKPQHDYSSTQVNLPAPIAKAMKRHAAQISDQDLGPDGREDQPHITLKYGLHGDNPGAVRKLLQTQPPITATLGTLSLFTNDDADVLKLNVASPDLAGLNKKLAGALPNTDTHPKYQPHATIAYLKPGTGKKYSGQKVPGVSGRVVTFHSVRFSGKGGQQVDIPLTGASDAPAAPEPLEGESPSQRSRIAINPESPASLEA